MANGRLKSREPQQDTTAAAHGVWVTRGHTRVIRIRRARHLNNRNSA